MRGDQRLGLQSPTHPPQRGGDEPGGQAVRVDSYRQRHTREAIWRRCWQSTLQFLLKQAHTVHVLAQVPASVGRAAGLATHDKGAPQPLFQGTDALRHRRGRDEERLSRAFEAAFPDDGGQRGQCCIVERDSVVLHHDR